MPKLQEPILTSTDADALCTECGLCCDGTFYGSVVVTHEERARLEHVKLRVVEHDGSLSMPQPCTALRGTLCDAYDARPAACAAYQCSLRKKVAANEVSLAEARQSIAKMRTLLTTIRDGFDCAPEMSIWEKILLLEEPSTPDGARDYAEAVEAVGDLLALGRSSFEPRFAGGGTNRGT